MSEPPPGAERRRSPRTPFEGSLSVTGRSPHGAPLATPARAINVSPHGAKLECGVEFARGTEVALENPQTGRRAAFRVVWVVAQPGQRWEMGVELVEGDSSFWGTAPAPGADRGI